MICCAVQHLVFRLAMESIPCLGPAVLMKLPRSSTVLSFSPAPPSMAGMS